MAFHVSSFSPFRSRELRSFTFVVFCRLPPLYSLATYALVSVLTDTDVTMMTFCFYGHAVLGRVSLYGDMPHPVPVLLSGHDSATDDHPPRVRLRLVDSLELMVASLAFAGSVGGHCGV